MPLSLAQSFSRVIFMTFPDNRGRFIYGKFPPSKNDLNQLTVATEISPEFIGSSNEDDLFGPQLICLKRMYFCYTILIPCFSVFNGSTTAERSIIAFCTRLAPAKSEVIQNPEGSGCRGLELLIQERVHSHSFGFH